MTTCTASEPTGERPVSCSASATAHATCSMLGGRASSSAMTRPRSTATVVWMPSMVAIPTAMITTGVMLSRNATTASTIPTAMTGCGRHGDGRWSRTSMSLACSTTTALSRRGSGLAAGGDADGVDERVVVRRADGPRVTDLRPLLRSQQHAGVERVEGGDGRRGVRRERRVDVSHARDDVALGVDAVEPVVLAHEPVPVVAALGVVLADADHGPGQRHLLRPGRVVAQRAAAGLHDGGAGRRGREVDEAGDRARVPALAEQATSADEHAAVAVLEEPRHPRHPLAAGPAALEAAVDDLEAGVADVLPQALQRLLVPGDRRAGDHQRVQVGGLVLEVLQRERGRPGLLVDDAVEVGGQRRGGALVVAEHEHAEPVAEVALLGQHDVGQRDRLGLAAREHPVDGTAASRMPRLVSW